MNGKLSLSQPGIQADLESIRKQNFFLQSCGKLKCSLSNQEQLSCSLSLQPGGGIFPGPYLLLGYRIIQTTQSET